MNETKQMENAMLLYYNNLVCTQIYRFYFKSCWV